LETPEQIRDRLLARFPGATVTLVPNGAGDLFGLTVAPDHDLVFVNDGTNAVDRAAPTSGGPTP